MAILAKLRRGSKDPAPSTPPHSRTDSFATLPSCIAPNTPGKLTFFDLPAELRNNVYDLVASDTILTLPSLEQRSKKLSVPVCGLLLASRQCRKEYLPLLYSTSPILVDIKDFDFQNLIRVIGGLYSTELKALRSNKTLIIRLRTQNCTRENLQALRKWIVHRADCLDRLPWNYDVLLAEPNGRIGCFRQSRELKFYVERLERLQFRLEDTLQWELQAIIKAFEQKGIELHEVLQGVRHPDPAPRGLLGGGLR